MDKDVERFLSECRADPWFQDHPEHIENTEEFFAALYKASDDSVHWQEVWDRVRALVTQTNLPLRDRFISLTELAQRSIELDSNLGEPKEP